MLRISPPGLTFHQNNTLLGPMNKDPRSSNKKPAGLIVILIITLSIFFL